MRTKNTKLKDVWQTPDEIISMIEAGDTITLDPCSGRSYLCDITYLDENGEKIEIELIERGYKYDSFNVSDGSQFHQAKTNIGNVNRTKDGLTQKWFGTVFVNPPFSKKKEWLRKAIEAIEYNHADRVYFVTPDSTDTKSWWHEYIAEYANYIWFSRGRINYKSPIGHEPMPHKCVNTNNVTFGTAVSVFGSDPPENTLECMKQNGQLVKTVK